MTSEWLGDGGVGLYEPIHGSAPDMAGCGIANPIGAILSVALLLRLSLGLEVEASCVEQAVSTTLDDGVFGADLGAKTPAGTAEITRAVVQHLDAHCHVAELRD